MNAEMPLICGDCHREWTETFSLPMNVTVFVKKVKAIRCPKCGSNKCLMKPAGDFFMEDKIPKGS
jgi:DNA-directed RNA polymerase subunit RPC12/RpoP